MLTKYKIGQILTSNKDVEVELALSGEKLIIPKGNKIIIGPDKFAHDIRNGRIQPLGEGDSVEGYDSEGIAEYLYLYLRGRFYIDEMLEETESDKESFIQEIAFALDDIGF